MSSLIGKIAFDKIAKEHVLISNGTCTLDHSTPEAYAIAHKGKTCVYAPSEAIAIRYLGYHKGKPILGWTYRGVDPAVLSCSDDMQHERKDFDAIITHKRSPYFVGRV